MAGFTRRHARAFALTLVVTAVVAVTVTFPRDLEWSRTLRSPYDPELRGVASEIGSWGSLAQYNFLIVIALWSVGAISRRRFWQRLAVVTFLSTVASGVACNVFRFTVGRPRPYTEESPLAFRGPQFQARYHGFPSGHTSTAFGTAIPLLVAVPEIGVPVTAFAFIMGWARVYDKAHYPTDVGVGAVLGILAGLAGGVPMFRLRRRLARAP
jgi:membrane-associated phospholipid phosphatase